MVLRTTATTKLKLVCLVLALAVCRCVTLEDRCAGVTCGDGEICLDLDDGPTCVCDVNHEANDEGVCVPLEDEEAPDDVDAGP